MSYLLRYPPPVGEQRYEFTLTSAEQYKQEIVPARTFGFMKDLKMMNELGLPVDGKCPIPASACPKPAGRSPIPG